jgi:phenylalanyl-tRNA synthetase beta chain
LSGLVSGSWAPRRWTGDESEIDLWRAKGILEGALSELGLAARFENSASETFLHPGRQSKVHVQGRELGFFGELHPRVQESFGSKTSVFVWELDLDAVLDLLGTASPAQSVRIGDFPGTRREVNVLIDKSRAAQEVVDSVRSLETARDPLVESVDLASVYEGAGLPEGTKAVLVRVSFRSPDRTPTDTEVNGIQDGIRQGLAAVPGFALK